MCCAASGLRPSSQPGFFLPCLGPLVTHLPSLWAPQSPVEEAQDFSLARGVCTGLPAVREHVGFPGHMAAPCCHADREAELWGRPPG